MNYQGHRHPVIKAMLTVLELLSDYESRTKTDEDPTRFLSMLNFSEDDIKNLLKKSSRVFYGRGHFTSNDSRELFHRINASVVTVTAFNEYDIIWEMFSSKGIDVAEVFKKLYSFSEEGRNSLTQINNLQEPEIVTLYYRYFNVR